MIACPECQQPCANTRGLNWHRRNKHGMVTPSDLAQQEAKARREARAVYTGSPQARADLDALLSRIERNERTVEGYDDLVAGGARQRRAGMRQTRVA